MIAFLEEGDQAAFSRVIAHCRAAALRRSSRALAGTAGVPTEYAWASDVLASAPVARLPWNLPEDRFRTLVAAISESGVDLTAPALCRMADRQGMTAPVLVAAAGNRLDVLQALAVHLIASLSPDELQDFLDCGVDPNLGNGALLAAALTLNLGHNASLPDCPADPMALNVLEVLLKAGARLDLAILRILGTGMASSNHEAVARIRAMLAMA